MSLEIDKLAARSTNLHSHRACAAFDPIDEAPMRLFSINQRSVGMTDGLDVCQHDPASCGHFVACGQSGSTSSRGATFSPDAPPAA